MLLAFLYSCDKEDAIPTVITKVLGSCKIKKEKSSKQNKSLKIKSTEEFYMDASKERGKKKNPHNTKKTKPQTTHKQVTT